MKMLYYDRIDVSEGTDVNKASYDICYYWYFLPKLRQSAPLFCWSFG